jgi:tetratricopeptide (TPR) repeat protein
MACLDRRRDAFGAVTRLMTEADEKIGARAIQAALELPTLDSCADADVLQRTAPRPTDPAVLAELEQVEAEVASVLALEIAGRYPDGLERSRRLLSRAEAIGYEPLLATLLFKLGYCEHVLGDKEAARAAFDRALGHAQNSGADDLAAQVLVQQVALIGHGFSDIESAIRIAGHAESAIARVGSPARLMGRLRVNLANAQMRAGNIEEGKRLYEEAMEVTESTPAARVTWRAAQANLAVVYARLGDNARAVESWTRALDTLRHDFGEHHPEYAVALTNLGVARFKLGRPNAREDLESALVLFERVDMERSIGAATAHHNLGLLLRGLGDLDGARDHYEQALSIKRELRGPDDTSSAMTATNLASLLSDLEPSDEVVAMAADAQAILRRELGADNPVTAAGIASYGKALLFNGAPRDAVPSLEEAFEISSRMTTDPYEHAKLQWFLARALWEADHDRPRALELVRSARPTIVASTERDALLAREMDAWLAERNAD